MWRSICNCFRCFRKKQPDKPTNQNITKQDQSNEEIIVILPNETDEVVVVNQPEEAAEEIVVAQIEKPTEEICLEEPEQETENEIEISQEIIKEENSDNPEVNENTEMCQEFEHEPEEISFEVSRNQEEQLSEQEERSDNTCHYQDNIEASEQLQLEPYEELFEENGYESEEPQGESCVESEINENIDGSEQLHLEPYEETEIILELFEEKGYESKEPQGESCVESEIKFSKENIEGSGQLHQEPFDDNIEGSEQLQLEPYEATANVLELFEENESEEPQGESCMESEIKFSKENIEGSGQLHQEPFDDNIEGSEQLQLEPYEATGNVLEFFEENESEEPQRESCMESEIKFSKENIEGSGQLHQEPFEDNIEGSEQLQLEPYEATGNVLELFEENGSEEPQGESCVESEVMFSKGNIEGSGQLHQEPFDEFPKETEIDISQDQWSEEEEQSSDLDDGFKVLLNKLEMKFPTEISEKEQVKDQRRKECLNEEVPKKINSGTTNINILKKEEINRNIVKKEKEKCVYRTQEDFSKEDDKDPFAKYPEPRGYLKLGEAIGEGNFGVVHMGWHQIKRKEVAIKIIKKIEDEDTILNELEILEKVSGHENIISFYGAFHQKPARRINQELWIATELCDGGSVLDLIKSKRNRSLEESWIAYICKQVLQGLYHLRKQRILHCDVKPDNLMLTEDAVVKIIDFGGAVTGGKSDSPAGDMAYLSPEAIVCMSKKGEFDHKADVWSLGMSAIHMAEGCVPYNKLPDKALIQQITRGPAPTLKGNKWSEKFHYFIEECLQKNPAERPSARQLLSHPFITDISNERVVQKNIMKHLQRANH